MFAAVSACSTAIVTICHRNSTDTKPMSSQHWQSARFASRPV
jgi:hypothetical protein